MILFLSNNPEITRPLFAWLCDCEGAAQVVFYEDRLNAIQFENEFKDVVFVVSYNYRHIIEAEIIRLLPNRIINLHISMLPWNRGASPNLWSFVDDTPKGVTIHVVDAGLDAGDILLQREISFDEGADTLESSYTKLHDAIQALFRENWARIRDFSVVPKKQSFEQTSYHSRTQTRKLMTDFEIKWTDRICDVKKKTSEYFSR